MSSQPREQESILNDSASAELAVPLLPIAIKPARSIPRRAFGVLHKDVPDKYLRKFSAISIVIPVSSPMASGSYQPLSGLNALTNPYWLQAPIP